jgi:putative transposase
VNNETLTYRKNAWEQEQRSIPYYDTIKMLPGWKGQKPELRQAHSQVLQEVCTRLHLAFQAFTSRVKTGEKPGYPRFRGYGRCDSFTYPQSGFELRGAGLYLSKIGIVKILLHVPICGKVKTLNNDRDAVGNWYANFTCEIDPEPLPKSEVALGIEVGLESFTTLRSGEEVPNHRFFRGDEKELAKAQRKLSKAEKGTPDRARRQHIHQRIANRRKDFAHKRSRQLVNEYGVIALEKLNRKNMLQNHRLAKSISAAAWSQLVQYLTYKAEYAGREVVLVDLNGTSQRCSG